MDFETPRNQVDIAPELQFITYESVDELRQQQEQAVYEARREAIAAALADGTSIKTASDDAKAEAEATFAAKAEAFVADNLDRDADPDRFDAVLELVKHVSADQMDSDTWKNGEDGDYTTSGRYQLEQALIELSAAENPAPAPTEGSPFDHSSPEFNEAAARLTETRDTYAKLSVEGRQRSLKGITKNAKEFTARLHTAYDAYQEAYNAVLDMYITGYRDQGQTPEYTYEKIMPEVIKEHAKFTAAEQHVLETDNSIRARAVRFMTKRPALYGFSAASGVATGLVGRLISKSIPGLLIGVTGGAAAGAYLGARLAKGALLSKVKNGVMLHKDFEKRREQDAADLKASLESHEIQSEDDVREAASLAGAVTIDRVEKDRKTNLRRTAIASAIGGSAALLAFELAPVVHDLVSGGDHTPSGSGTQGPTGPHGGGQPGGGKPPVDNYGFKPNVTVEHGHGYIKEIQDLAAQQHIHLTGAQATEAYHHMLNNQGTHFFTNDPNLPHNVDNWISRPGAATWDHAHLTSFHHWLQTQHDLEKVA